MLLGRRDVVGRRAVMHDDAEVVAAVLMTQPPTSQPLCCAARQRVHAGARDPWPASTRRRRGWADELQARAGGSTLRLRRATTSAVPALHGGPRGPRRVARGHQQRRGHDGRGRRRAARARDRAGAAGIIGDAHGLWRALVAGASTRPPATCSRRRAAPPPRVRRATFRSRRRARFGSRYRVSCELLLGTPYRRSCVALVSWQPMQLATRPAEVTWPAVETVA